MLIGSGADGMAVRVPGPGVECIGGDVRRESGMIANIPNAGTLGLGFIQNLGPLELLIIFAVLLLLFGRRLPEVGKSLGKGIVEFKKGISGVEDDANRAAQQPPPGSGYQQALPGQGAPQQWNNPQQLPQGQYPPQNAYAAPTQGQTMPQTQPMPAGPTHPPTPNAPQ